jgi:hypothetical protein
MPVLTTAQITIYDVSDIWVTEEYPINPPDKTLIFRPGFNTIEKYDASSGTWSIVSEHDTTIGELNELDDAVADLIDSTIDNPEYQDLILDRSNADILREYIAKYPFLLGSLFEALTIGSNAGAGTTLRNIASSGGCSLSLGQDEIRMQNPQSTFMSVSPLKATLPPTVQVAEPASGPKFRIGNFVAEHQVSNGNLTFRKV